ncbi:hypothetical protein Raf01_38060 [Rugosimonospora africana]|uniref:Uncharacterized protein n=2 Tax=Rugosimonospora africana TaxID=556532 RepID=A0A8J3QS33_9ACTN|nr:hypothetical protein Raf01_38060 [Rugosimonospora africana]
MAAGALAACVAGTCVLLSGAAQAAEPSVDFTGGCGLLGIGATSQPETPNLSMTAGSRLRVVNHLGANATLVVNGRRMRTVRPEHSFRLTLAAEETTTVQLSPACPAPLVSVAAALTVAVTAVEAPGTGSPSTAPPSAPPEHSPTRTPTVPPSRPPQPQPAPVTATPRAPAHTSGPAPGPSRPARRPHSRTSVAGTVAAAVPPTAYVGDAVPASPSGPPPLANQPYIGPVAPLGADRAARYSLALIATVLILGTGLAALRLLRSQRHVGAHRRAS